MQDKKIRKSTDLLVVFLSLPKTSSPKGNDAHLRATMQSQKKWIDQFFRHLRAANSVVRGPIWLNFKLIQALTYVIITCKYNNNNNNKDFISRG